MGSLNQKGPLLWMVYKLQGSEEKSLVLAIGDFLLWYKQFLLFTSELLGFKSVCEVTLEDGTDQLLLSAQSELPCQCLENKSFSTSVGPDIPASI